MPRGFLCMEDSMHAVITMQMADGTESDVHFTANGATALRFRQVFGRELIESIKNIIDRLGAKNVATLMQGGVDDMSLESLTPEQLNAVIAVVTSGETNTISQLAYIMNASAEKKDMRALDMESWLDWMEQFETMEFYTHAMDFIMLYMNNRMTTSIPKKKEDRLNEK